MLLVQGRRDADNSSAVGDTRRSHHNAQSVMRFARLPILTIFSRLIAAMRLPNAIHGLHSIRTHKL